MAPNCKIKKLFPFLVYYDVSVPLTRIHMSAVVSDPPHTLTYVINSFPMILVLLFATFLTGIAALSFLSSVLLFIHQFGLTVVYNHISHTRLFYMGIPHFWVRPATP